MAVIIALGACMTFATPSSASDRPKHHVTRTHRTAHVQHPDRRSVRHPARHHTAHGVGVPQKGVASVYHHRFNGRKMADGGKFSVSSDSAASRTLPIGTVVRVTNLKNGRSQTVHIRDRGPRRGGRILDLSPGSARQLGMEKPGLIHVEVTPLSMPRRG